MTTASAEVRAAANRGIAAMRRQDRVQAAVHFDAALGAAEAIADDRPRRDEVSVLATLFMQFGFNDLGLMAAEAAVDLDRSLRLEAELTGDLLALGNAHSNMENEAKAEAAYREALRVALKSERWADAAGASTNLAGMIGNRGDFAQAAEMLKTSLGYLERGSFVETEVNTRVTLLQVLELGAGEVEEALENARALCGPLWDAVPPHARDVVAEFVRRLVERYARTHAEARQPAWMAKNFPQVQERG